MCRERGDDEALGRYLSLLPSAQPDMICIGFLSSSSSVFLCSLLGHEKDDETGGERQNLTESGFSQGEEGRILVQSR